MRLVFLVALRTRLRLSRRLLLPVFAVLLEFEWRSSSFPGAGPQFGVLVGGRFTGLPPAVVLTTSTPQRDGDRGRGIRSGTPASSFVEEQRVEGLEDLHGGGPADGAQNKQPETTYQPYYNRNSGTKTAGNGNGDEAVVRTRKTNSDYTASAAIEHASPVDIIDNVDMFGPEGSMAMRGVPDEDAEAADKRTPQGREPKTSSDAFTTAATGTTGATGTPIANISDSDQRRWSLSDLFAMGVTVVVFAALTLLPLFACLWWVALVLLTQGRIDRETESIYEDHFGGLPLDHHLALAPLGGDEEAQALGPPSIDDQSEDGRRGAPPCDDENAEAAGDEMLMEGDELERARPSRLALPGLLRKGSGNAPQQLQPQRPVSPTLASPFLRNPFTLSPGRKLSPTVSKKSHFLGASVRSLPPADVV